MSTNFGDENDPLAARLRDALTSEAAMVTPSDDGLQQIRSGSARSSSCATTSTSPRPTSPTPSASAAAP